MVALCYRALESTILEDKSLGVQKKRSKRACLQTNMDVARAALEETNFSMSNLLQNTS